MGPNRIRSKAPAMLRGSSDVAVAAAGVWFALDPSVVVGGTLIAASLVNVVTRVVSARRYPATDLGARVLAGAAGSSRREPAAVIAVEASRGDLLAVLSPAIEDRPRLGVAYIEWSKVPALLPGLSQDRQALIRLAASLAGSGRVVVGDELAHLTREDRRVVRRALV